MDSGHTKTLTDNRKLQVKQFSWRLSPNAFAAAEGREYETKRPRVTQRTTSILTDTEVLNVAVVPDVRLKTN